MGVRKPVFTALAETRIVEGRHRLAMKSPEHFQAQINKLPIGKTYGVAVEEYKSTRSSQQLAYYWVLLSYLADYSGHEKEELHDAIMRQKFGTKKIVMGPIAQEVRRSISDAARFPKGEMVDLITDVLEICKTVGVAVPTREELGYLPG